MDREELVNPADATSRPLLEARNISKYFGAITALHGVNFHVDAGEVLGVVGDNGAGKSTLMKILSGLYAPSEGDLVFEGEAVRFAGPKEARLRGIEMVYQDFALAGNMPIYENIYLGREPGRKFGPLRIVDHEKSRSMARCKPAFRCWSGTRRNRRRSRVDLTISTWQ